jgi:HEAT repeat protein
MDSADLFDPGMEAQARSGSELTALLVELARVVKARGFYAPGNPKLATLFERGLMTWRGDLERHGDLEFEVVGAGFRSAGVREVVGHAQLAGLHQALRERGVRHVRVEAWIDAEAFAGLVEALCLDPDALAAQGGALRALYARVPMGIVLNETPAEALDSAPADEEEAWAPDDAEGLALSASEIEAAALALEDPTGPTEPLDAWDTPTDPVPHEEGAPGMGAFFDDEEDAGDEGPDTSLFGAPAGRDGFGEEDETPAFAADDDAPEAFSPGATFDLGGEDAPAPAVVREGPPGGADEGDFSFVDDADAPAADAAPPEEDLDARDDLFGPAATEERLAEAPAEAAADEAPAGPEGFEAEFTFADEAPAPAADEPEEIELTDLPEEAPADRRPSWGELEEGPLERGVVDLRSAEVVDLLRELHDCEETTQYLELARRACQHAERAAECGRLEDAYRVMLVLSLHASQRGKRPDRQTELAQEFLVSIARGERLEHLIDRACAPGPESSVRATQILLQLGEEVVPALLGAAVLEKDPDRRGQMHGVLIAMGEKTLTELLRSMDADDPELVRTAVRLAGETQNPGAIAKLADLLKSSPDKEAREEAAKALVRIGTPRAVEILVGCIDDPRMGDAAVYCLGACGSARPVEPLVAAMHAAIDAGRLDRAREIIRALGRLGRAEAVPALAELLLRKSVLGRRKLREVKLASATALAGLPGDEAVGALAQAARSRDPQLRRVAQTALDRRARSLSRAASA